MKEVPIKTKLELKHKLESEWIVSDYVPIQSEPIVYDIEVDADGNTLELPEGRTAPYTYERMKIGDGVHLVKDLPFLVEQGDWNQLDETAPDYIKNRTHGEYTTLVKQEDFSMYLENPGKHYGEWINEYKANSPFKNDNYYLKSGDNTYFAGTCKSDYYVHDVREYGDYGAKMYLCCNLYYFGNISLATLKGDANTQFNNVDWNNDTGEDFALLFIGYDEEQVPGDSYNEPVVYPYYYQVYFYTKSGIDSESIDISLYTEHVEIKTLDEKYIPDIIARISAINDLQNNLQSNINSVELTLSERISNIEENQTVPEHEHEFKDIADSAYDDSSKWQEIIDILNQHAYGELNIIYPAEGCDSATGKLGMGYRVCACCGRKKQQEIKPKHQYTYMAVDDVYHAKTCNICSESITEPHINPQWHTENGQEEVICYLTCDACSVEMRHVHFVVDYSVGATTPYSTCGYKDCPLQTGRYN